MFGEQAEGSKLFRLRSIKNFLSRRLSHATFSLFLGLHQILYTGVVVYAPALALNQGELLTYVTKICESSALKKYIYLILYGRDVLVVMGSE